MDDAVPVLETLASAANVSVDQAVTLIDDVAAKAAPTSGCGTSRRASCASRSNTKASTDWHRGSVQRPAPRLPRDARVGAAGTRSRHGACAAARCAGARRAVSLATLDDRDLDVLEASDLSPAWYPVLGALERLWDVPKRKPSSEEVAPSSRSGARRGRREGAPVLAVLPGVEGADAAERRRVADAGADEAAASRAVRASGVARPQTHASE